MVALVVRTVQPLLKIKSSENVNKLWFNKYILVFFFDDQQDVIDRKRAVTSNKLARIFVKTHR